MSPFEALPGELVADILSELDLSSLITISALSQRLRAVTSDPYLNPWRRAILRSLEENPSDPHLLHLSARNIVPRQTWVEALAFAQPEWILYQATLPNLTDKEWGECFARRFLPSWKKWKKEGRWRPAFLATLSLVNHRRKTYCTADEAWTRYIVLNRNGSANQLQATSRNFSPIALFHEIKVQNDLLHLDTRIRVVVQFQDVNPNADALLHPPDVSLTRQRYPTPSVSHANYPNFTPGGHDRRWTMIAGVKEGGRVWVGSLMIVAQLISPPVARADEDGFELVVGQGHSQYGSFTWTDLFAIAPWMEDRVLKRIEGPGLGID